MPNTVLMKRATRANVALVFASMLVMATIWGTASLQRSTAETRTERVEHADALAHSTLEQELAVRGATSLGRAQAMTKYLEGTEEFEHAAEEVLAEAKGEEEVLALLARISEAHATWQGTADGLLLDEEADDAANQLRAKLVDSISADSEKLVDAVEAEQDADQERLTLALIGLTLAVVLLLGFFGTRMLGRREREALERRRQEDAYRDSQAEFADTMQVVGDEQEAHDLLKRHLERALPGAQATVLNRNNSANRLEATTEAPVELAAVLGDGVEPRACIAARLGRQHTAGPDAEPLLTCTLCGKEGSSTCTPLLVSGEVIGSVLVQHVEPLGEHDSLHVVESVAQAAPVLGNLRNLAIAETRAATDALTGLPNRRALQDTLKRMVAQSGRSLQPLSALALDLDHFKQLNDRFGHEKGDEALAAVGRIISESLRESDFAARAGGEEFCVLLPDTDSEGAAVVADKLRLAISRIEVPGVERQITGSIGIAAYPAHAFDAPTLLRKADRALYLAKENGRHRVEVAANASPAPRADAAGAARTTMEV